MTNNIQIKTVKAEAKETRLLGIGRIWENENPRSDKSPVMGGAIDIGLGFGITLVPGARFNIFKNAKREGSRDADYRLVVEVPAEVAIAEIARQKAARTPQEVADPSEANV